MIDLEKEKAKEHCPSGINFHCPIILHWARRQTHIQGRSDRLSRGTSTRSQKDNRFMHLISSSNTLIIRRPFRAANTVSQLLSTGPTPNDSPPSQCFVSSSVMKMTYVIFVEALSA